MKKKIIIAALVVAAAALGWKLRSAKDFRYAGTIEATEVDISARISGVIQDYRVKEGDSIAKNSLIAALDCDDARLAADIARKDYDRADELLKTGSLSRENYDRLKYRRDDAALRAGWCRITAPEAGRVLYKYHEAGELISPGAKLVTMADLSEVYAWVYIPHDLIAKLSTSMEVPGYLPELGGRQFSGKIAVINEEAEFTPKNVQTRAERTRLVFGVKVIFKNPEGALKPGMTIEVKLPD